MTIEQQVLEKLRDLPPEKQKEVLDFARRLTVPAGTPGRGLLRFVGCIDTADLAAMSHAIQEGCEKLEPNAW
jgi:hypothetical protein